MLIRPCAYIILSFECFLSGLIMLLCVNLDTLLPCDCTLYYKWVFVWSPCWYKSCFDLLGWFWFFHSLRLRTRLVGFWIIAFTIYEVHGVKPSHGFLGLGYWILQGINIGMIFLFECFDHLWNFFKLFLVLSWDDTNSCFLLRLSYSCKASRRSLCIEIFLCCFSRNTVSAKFIFICLTHRREFLLFLKEW